MADIILFLKTQYDSTGLDQALYNYKAVVSAIQATRQEAAGVIQNMNVVGPQQKVPVEKADSGTIKSLREQRQFLDENIDLWRQQAAVMQSSGKNGRALAKVYSEIADNLEKYKKSLPGVSDEILVQKSSIEKLTEDYVKLKQAMPEDAMRGVGSAESLDKARKSGEKLAKELEDLENKYRLLREAALKAQDPQALKVINQKINAVKRERAEIEALAQVRKKSMTQEQLEQAVAGKTRAQIKAIANEYVELHIMNMKATKSTRDFVDKLDQVAQKSNIDAVDAYSKGMQEVGFAMRYAAEGFKTAAKQQAAFGHNLGSLSGIMAGLGPRMSALMGPLNRLGFAMFIVRENLRTWVNGIKTILDTIEASARRILEQQIFNSLISGMGELSTASFDAFKKISSGFMTLEEQQRSFSRVAATANKELLNALPALAEIALGAAAVTGQFDNINGVFDTLIKGIQKESPLLIDNAEIYLKVGRVIEDYAKANNVAASSIDPVLRKSLILQEVLGEQSEAYRQIGQAIQGSLAYSMSLLKQEMTNMVQTGFDSFLASIAGSFAAISKEGETAAEWVHRVGVRFRLALSFLGSWPAVAKQNLTIFWRWLGVKIFEIAALLKKVEIGLLELGDKLPFVDLRDDIAQAKIELQEANDDIAYQIYLLNTAKQAGYDLTQQVAEIGLGIDKLGDIAPPELVEVFNEGLDSAKAFLEYLTGDQYKFDRQMEDEEQRFQEQMNEIRQKAQQDGVKAYYDYKEKLKDLDEDYRQKQEDIELDYNRALADLSEDDSDKKEEIKKKYYRKQEDLLEDHQRKLRDIERKYEMSRLKAILDRNAKALFEAIATREDDIESAEDTFKDKNKDAEKQYKKELEDLEDSNKDKEKELEKSYKRKLEDAKKADKRARDNAWDAYQDQLDDLKENLRKQENALIKSYNDRVAEMEANFREQSMLRDAQELLEEISDRNHAQVMLTQKEAEMQGLMDILNDYYDWRKQYQQDLEDLENPSGGSGGNTVTDTGIGGTGNIGNPCLDPGSQCAPEGRIVTCSGGSVYMCINGSWVFQGGPDQYTPVTTGSSSSGNNASEPVPVSLGGSGGTGKKVNLTINVTGDQTMSDFFKALAYEAIMEIL